MEVNEWKKNIVDKAKRQIQRKSNMSSNDITELMEVLTDYLEEGMSYLKKWRKIKNDDEFTNGEYDTSLVNYIINKNLVDGRQIYQGYSSGGISASMKASPESILKGENPQRLG